MTVQELFKKLNRGEFVDEYLSYCDESKSTGEKEILDALLDLNDLLDAFNKLNIIPDNSRIVFCTPLLGENHLDSFIIKKEDLLDTEIENNEIPEGYAYEFNCMSDILSYSVSNACLYAFGELKVACAILYEMTFFGYNIEEQKETSEKETAQLNKAIEEIHNAKLISFEEFCKEHNWVDERKDFEKEFDHNNIATEHELLKKLKQELCKLEIHYLFEKL